MSDLRQAARIAQDWMEYWLSGAELTYEDHPRLEDDVQALRDALAQPERKPLTNREMYELCPAVLMPARGAYEFALGLAKFARAIEKAHGIGGEHE